MLKPLGLGVGYPQATRAMPMKEILPSLSSSACFFISSFYDLFIIYSCECGYEILGSNLKLCPFYSSAPPLTYNRSPSLLLGPEVFCTIATHRIYQKLKAVSLLTLRLECQELWTKIFLLSVSDGRVSKYKCNKYNGKIEGRL